MLRTHLSTQSLVAATHYFRFLCPLCRRVGWLVHSWLLYLKQKVGAVFRDGTLTAPPVFFLSLR